MDEIKIDPKNWRLSESGLIIPKRIHPIAIDLFAGCGGFSLGIMQAGFEVIAALEWDTSAAITYMHNLGSYPIDIHFATPEDKERLEKELQRNIKNKKGKIVRCMVSGGSGFWQNEGMVPVSHFFFGDIRKFTGEQILKAIGMERGEVDVVVGGPPCQGFSQAGKQNVMDPRNSLIFEFARMVLEIYPKSIVMENVPEIARMVTPEGLPVVDTFCKILEEGDFGNINLLKRSLLMNSGLGTMMKGRKQPDIGDSEVCAGGKRKRHKTGKKQEQMAFI